MFSFMQFIDLKAQQNVIKDTIDANIRRVLEHGQYIMGPEVGELEHRLAQYVGTAHAVACSSGTDALLLALMAYGVGPGDAVFTTPFTFIATAEVISVLGATPVFVDIEPGTFNINPGLLSRAIAAVNNNDPGIYPLPQPHSPTSNRTPRGIIAVDLFGLPADYDRINALARDHGMFVIEDAAQSFGAVYKGNPAGSLSHIACTSFFPAKPLGCYGDGGMCFTDDHDLAEAIRSIRVHGKGAYKYDNARVGINGRLDTLQAAILLAKFDIFPEEVNRRQKVAHRYEEKLRPLSSVVCPLVPEGYKSIWAQYSILARDETHRSNLQEALRQENIPTAIYYPKPLHLQTAFSSLGYKEGDFPVSEDCANRIFSIPMHPYLEIKDQEHIAEIISSI
jgi:UDP-2-acetamido-2-deoxy-ribo-hexuluronate aminotransferase